MLIQHIKSSPRHPSSNGEAERSVKTFKTAMKAMKNESGTTQTKVARFLLSHRTTPHSTTKEIPAKIFLGRELRTRLSVLKPDLRQSIMKKVSKSGSNRDLNAGDVVHVRDYQKSPELGRKG